MKLIQETCIRVKIEQSINLNKSNNMKKQNFKENELVEHSNLGKVRMFEYGDKISLVKILNPDLKTWSIKSVQTKTLVKT